MNSSVPVSILGMNSYAKGVLRLEDEELVLDFGVMSQWSWRMSQPKQVHIRLEEVEALEFKKGIFPFHPTLRLRVRNLELLASVPGSDGAEITLSCKRRYRHIAQELANYVTLQLLERVIGSRAQPAIP